MIRERKDRWSPRALTVLLVVSASIAAVGYNIGLQENFTIGKAARQKREQRPTQGEQTIQKTTLNGRDVHPAVDYKSIGSAHLGPNADFTSDLKTLVRVPDDLFAKIEIDPIAKRESLDRRAALRAYNGAPPVVPHPIDQLSSAACMACHGEGLKTKSLSAAMLPHPYLTNCTQCHVEQSMPLLTSAVNVENTFQGLPAPFAGPRAWTGAPPIVPHSTFMRENCLACHGQVGRSGMQSTHFWRQSCLQCHAPSAQLDQTLLEPIPHFLAPPQIETESANE